jgi:hypothetical protein
MSKRLIVGVDVDGVLANFVKSARSLCKQMFDGRPPDSLVQEGWGFDSLGITPEEEDKMWKKIDSIPNWWMNHEKLPYTDSLIWLRDNARLIFITNRKDGTGLPIEQQTALWIARNYPIPQPTVLLSNAKGPLAAALKLDYFIDDRDKNVIEVAFGAPKCYTFIQDYPYNQHIQEKFQEGFIQRVSNLNEFCEHIRRIEGIR